MANAILIIDDNKEDLFNLHILLESEGYKAFSYCRVEEALKLLTDRPDEIDLILFDIRTSVSDEFRTIARIREEPKIRDIPILFLTADNADDVERLIELESGSFDFISKPVERHDLSIRIAVFIRLKNAQDQLGKKRKTGTTRSKNTELQAYAKKLAKTNEDLRNEIIVRKKAEERSSMAKEQAEVDERIKSEFIASLSHDLRNPLHGILSFANFGLKKIDSDKISIEKFRHYYAGIKDAGTRLLGLLNDILELAKLDAGIIRFNFNERNLVTLAKGAIAELHSKKNQNELSFEIVEPEAPIMAQLDAKYIGQVVKNLFACIILQSSPAKRNIVVSMVEDKMPLNDQTPDIPIPAIRFSIIDRNLNIPEDKLNTIFDMQDLNTITDPTARTTRLSMVVCRSIIERHQGRIWAERNPEGGTVFAFMVPKNAPETS